MIGDPRHSGPMRARVIRSHEPRERGKLPNKANFKQPSGNQWVTAGFQYHGTTRLGKTRQIAPPGYEGPLLRASGPAEQRQGDDDYRSSGATEQQSDQTKPIRHNSHRFSSLHDSSERIRGSPTARGWCRSGPAVFRPNGKGKNIPCGAALSTGRAQAIPRHIEIPNNLAREICRSLKIPEVGQRP